MVFGKHPPSGAGSQFRIRVAYRVQAQRFRPPSPLFPQPCSRNTWTSSSPLCCGLDSGSFSASSKASCCARGTLRGGRTRSGADTSLPGGCTSSLKTVRLLRARSNSARATSRRSTGHRTCGRGPRRATGRRPWVCCATSWQPWGKCLLPRHRRNALGHDLPRSPSRPSNQLHTVRNIWRCPPGTALKRSMRQSPVRVGRTAIPYLRRGGGLSPDGSLLHSFSDARKKRCLLSRMV